MSESTQQMVGGSREPSKPDGRARSIPRDRRPELSHAHPIARPITGTFVVSPR
jgi:hypothetical protein